MRQASLKLNSYARSASITDNRTLNRRIFRIMLWFLIALAFCYVSLVGSMVFNIVERKALEVNAHSISNEIGELELQYLTASNKIDLALAESLGFKETKAKFATRKALGSIEFSKNEL
ncbi:hypothetical protein KKA39_00730 [Patescibacteria group bacterium]|nr:hypothetical protein [Patescibacteria group bacterium]MBU1727824.1 hypothetical protein [Patescibacteria group bacterium]